MFNIRNGTLAIQGKLPLTPGSSLTWFGFSEEGQLSSFDSKVWFALFLLNALKILLGITFIELDPNFCLILQGVLRVFTNQYGGSWLPVFRYTILLSKSKTAYYKFCMVSKVCQQKFILAVLVN